MESLQTLAAQMRNADPGTTRRVEGGIFTPPPHDAGERIDAFEAIIGKLPLSVRAWAEVVGNVDFMGEYPGLASIEAESTSAFDIRGTIRQMLRHDPDMVDFFKNLDDAQLEAAAARSPFPGVVAGMAGVIHEEIEAGIPASPGDKPSRGTTIRRLRIDFDEASATVLVEDAWIIHSDETDDPTLLNDRCQTAPRRRGSVGYLQHHAVYARADTLLHGTDMYLWLISAKVFAGGFPGLRALEHVTKTRSFT
jgi:hypothetical protein